MEAKVRILVLEDQPADAELMLRELSRAGYEPEWKRVETEPEYVAELDSGWEIILADYALPQFDGIRALELLNARGLDIPFIVVSASIGEDKAVGAMRAGACDYVMKDDLARLAPSVARALREAAGRRERRLAEEALRRSEERHRTILRTAMDGFWRVDMQGRLLEVNGAYCRMSGYGEQELLAMRVADVEAVETATDVAAHVQGIVANGEDRFQTRHRRKDGSSFAVEVSAQYRSAEGGYLVAFLRDITERTQADAALRGSEEKYRGLFESSRDAIMTLEPPSWRFTAGNPATVRMFGAKDEEDFISHGPWELSPERQPDGRASDQKAREMIETALREGSHLFEWTHRRVDGAEFPADVVLTRMERGGKPLLLATVRDITERTRAEESHARLAMAVEQAAETVMITDAGARILYVNPAFEKASGYTREEAIGQNPRMMKSGKHDAEFYRGMWEVLARGGVWSGRLINKRKDGTLYEEDVTISPVRDATGRVVNYVGVKRDVTREAQLEAQLRQSQKMEAIGRLAGGVAHDFNNMLAVITAYASLLLQDAKEGDPMRPDLEEIRSAAEKAAGLTRQLLAFSRKQVTEPRRLDLNREIEQMERMLRRILGEDVELRTVPGEGLGTVLVDPGQIEQVIMNLAVNARDAMPDGGRLTIETRNTELDEGYCREHLYVSPGAYVLLAVSDDGHGMGEAIRAHIFEPFFTTKEQGKGTGLGLSTVYGIVKQSGGHVAVYSEPGVGTTFKIYFPCIDAPAEAREQPIGDITPGGRETVLLVEDEEAVLKVAAQILGRRGYRVLPARNAGEALLYFEREPAPIHLLLTDVVMPQISGKDLAQRLLRIRPGLKVLYMSGYTGNAIVHHGVLDPGVRLIEKPFTPEELLRKVRQVLDER